MMASVYILYSLKLDNYYTGSCKDLSYRIEQHISHHFINSYTRKADDWKLYWYMDDLGYEQAGKIDSHIKRMKSNKYIQNLKSYPEIIEKLRLKYI